MKNKFFKLYVIAFYLCSTLVMGADPGDNNSEGNLESDGDNTSSAPINDYIWVLAAVVLVYVFLKFRAIQKNSIQ